MIAFQIGFVKIKQFYSKELFLNLQTTKSITTSNIFSSRNILLFEIKKNSLSTLIYSYSNSIPVWVLNKFASAGKYSLLPLKTKKPNIRLFFVKIIL